MATDTNDGRGYWICATEGMESSVWVDLTKAATIRDIDQPGQDTFIIYIGNTENGIVVDSLTNSGAHARVRQWLDSRRV